MTREKIISAYIEIDEDTGEEYGYKIVSYIGVDGVGCHLFRCVADGTEEKSEDAPIYAVIDEKTLIPIPT